LGRIQIDRIAETQKWADNVKNVQKDGRVRQANNHYAGFGPGTANIFRNMLGLPEAKWEEKEEEDQARDSHQLFWTLILLTAVNEGIGA
jgi:hypothetical protein